MIDKIGVVLKSQCTFAKLKFGNANYFMALYKKELSELEGKLKCTSSTKKYFDSTCTNEESSLVQVESKLSVLVRDDQYYYKLVPSLAETKNLMDFQRIYYRNKADAVQFKHLSKSINMS